VLLQDNIPGRLDWGLRVDVALDLGDVHVGAVAELRRKSVVLQNDGLKDLLEVLIGVLVTGVDAAVLVVKLNGASDGLAEGEAGGLGLDILQLLPQFRGDVLGNQALGRLDGWEIRLKEKLCNR
jgi:hypothetical protein